MNAEQKVELESLGWRPDNWSPDIMERLSWKVMWNLAIRLGIKAEGRHKESLWQHAEDTVDLLTEPQLKSYIRSKARMDALAMTILLTHKR